MSSRLDQTQIQSGWKGTPAPSSKNSPKAGIWQATVSGLQFREFSRELGFRSLLQLIYGRVVSPQSSFTLWKITLIMITRRNPTNDGMETVKHLFRAVTFNTHFSPLFPLFMRLFLAPRNTQQISGSCWLHAVFNICGNSLAWTIFEPERSDDRTMNRERHSSEHPAPTEYRNYFSGTIGKFRHNNV